jgi:hypothetical protein
MQCKSFICCFFNLAGTKKEAEDAAAARALDCLMFRSGVENNNLCLEDPYSVHTIPETWKRISECVSVVKDFDWQQEYATKTEVLWPIVRVRFGVDELQSIFTITEDDAKYNAEYKERRKT